MTKQITKAMISMIGESLRRNKQVRRNLPDGSRLHIDRQLPFLCLYRRPYERDDPGTEKLLMGEAAYLLATSQQRHFAPLVWLVEEIRERQVEVFGDFLLLELWAGEEGGDEGTPLFTIHADRHGAPQQLLEKMESALLKVRIAGHESSVAISYHSSVHPPGLKALLHNLDRQVTTIGLEVKPVYRDAQSGELYPLDLRKLHHQLAKALKRSFYAFTHSHTVHRPKHYHELGRRAMTQAVRESDRRLAAISNRFDLLLHVTPVNVSQAWEEFLRSRFTRLPVFLYRPRPIDPAMMKRELFSVPIERIEDPTLAHIFTQKQSELDRQITMLAERNTPNFLYSSRQLYGDIERPLLQQAEQLLQQVIPQTHEEQSNEMLSVEQFVLQARDELNYYQQQDSSLAARVELRDDITGILVSKGNFLVGRDARVPAARAAAALAHEVGTHVLTYHNGRQQPLQELYTGMAGYEPMQEGLAVLAEYLVGGMSRSRLRLLAGRVVAVQSIHHGADFIETFKMLREEHGFSQYQAFTITMRVYRGGGYTKDAVYLRGLLAVLQQLSEGREIEDLLLGKISDEQLPLVDELRWRKVLENGPLRPRYLELPQVQQRLAQLRSGMTLLELLVEAS